MCRFLQFTEERDVSSAPLKARNSAQDFYLVYPLEKAITLKRFERLVTSFAFVPISS